MDRPDSRLVTISEGAFAGHDVALAKDAIRAAQKIQDKNQQMTDMQVKADVDKIKSKAGFKLKDYLDKGKAAFSSKMTERP